MTTSRLTERRSQPPLALSVPLSRFTSRVGGGSAFFVRRHERTCHISCGLLAAAIICGGCSRTYISTGDPGIPSPDGDTRLCITAHGAYGRSYVDRTGKLLDICIKRGSSTNETILFLHRYRFVGSDVWGAADWHSTNEVTRCRYMIMVME